MNPDSPPTPDDAAVHLIGLADAGMRRHFLLERQDALNLALVEALKACADAEMLRDAGRALRIAEIAAGDDAGIEAVVIAYTDGERAWASASLTQSGEAWFGSFPAGADTEFLIQVVDQAGNVATSDNNGRYDGSFSVYLPLILR